MNRKVFWMAFSSAALALTLPADTYTSASYVQNGLIAQWDGIDNAGTGTHDPNAKVWKNLASTGSDYDMTLTGSARWKDGNSLVVKDCSAYGTKAAPLVKTIEVVFKTDYVYGRIMFNLGNSRQMVVFDTNKINGGTSSEEYVSIHGYFYAISMSHRYVEWFPDPKALRYMAGTFSDVYTTANAVYGDGVLRTDGTRSNNWGNGDGVVMLGDRAKSGSGYGWRGEVQAIRLYDCELTAEEIAQNHAIDVVRFGDQMPSSADYVRDGLVAQWDGLDNVDTGTHDSTATVWKNLASTGSTYDPTLTNRATWNVEGRALGANGLSAFAPVNAPEYKTIEVVCKRTSTEGRIMFNSGYKTRFVLFDKTSTMRTYFSGDTKSGGKTTLQMLQPFSASEINFFAARYDDNGNVESVFKDANQREEGTYYNEWNPGTGITVGGRIASSDYPWYGEVYAIRLYNRRLTKAELARNHRIDCKRFLTSASYIQEGLAAHWDGIDNVGRGQHDSSTNIWKNLASTGSTYDLRLGTGIWTAESLMSVGKAELAATGTTYRSYESVEAVFCNAMHKTSSIVFNTGLTSRYVALGGKYFMLKDGLASTNTINRYSNGRYSVSGIVTSNDTAYVNGSRVEYVSYGDQWGVSNYSYVQIGGRDHPGYSSWPYYGDVFAIRTYNNRLSANNVAYNYKVDQRRFGLDAPIFTWNADAGGGMFTSANWTAWKQTTANVPGASDAVVLPAGDYTVTLAGETVVESLSVGAGAKLKMALPSGADATDAAMLTVFGEMTAASDAGIVLDARAFGRKHAEESITLVECEKDSTAALQALADNLSFDNTDRCGTVAVVDGVRLVYTAPQKPGTILGIR